MNTRSMGSIPFLKPGEKYVFCNDELETAFVEDDLETITEKWNLGYNIERIAEEHKRDPDEIFLAIFHQAREGKVFRRLTYKQPVRHLKIKKDIPTVIEYENRRYVYEPQSKWR